MQNLGNEILKYSLAIILSIIGTLFVIQGGLSPKDPSFSLIKIVFQSKEMCFSVIGIFLCFLLIGILITYASSIKAKLNEMRRINRVLKKKDEIKTRFLAFAAHNLRTPATALRWSLNDFLKNEYGHLTKEQQTSIQELYSVSLNMLNIIEDFLDISKLELQKFEIGLKPVSLKDFKKEILEVIEEFRPLAKEHDVAISNLFDINEDARIHIDLSQIVRVIENLIENAINYTLSKGTILIDISNNKENISFSIKDTGIGIPKAEHPMIFGEFFRSSNAKRHKSTGSGIGLYLARKIIEAHGGKIKFISEENVGSTFSFTLPMIKESEREVTNVFKKL